MDSAADKTIRISVTGLLATGLVLAGLLAAYLLGDAGGTAAQAAPADDTTAAEAVPAGRVTMAGAGQAIAVPDQLGFSLEVHATRPTLAEALDDTGATLRRVLARLGDHGVAKGDVQTSGLSMNPVYDYHQSGPPTLRGYRVSQRAQVLVTDLKQGGAAITTAVEVGGNTVRVGDIELSVADPEAALAKARAKAVEAATAKAEEYAEATGQELGAVLTLREVGAPSSDREAWSQSLDMERASYDGATASVPIRSGKDDLTVRVEVVWTLAG